ncbi:hypothetical protein, partial [Vibrio campbellii]
LAEHRKITFVVNLQQKKTMKTYGANMKKACNLCDISSHNIAAKVCIFDQLLKLNVVKLPHYNQSLGKQMALGSTMFLLSDYGEV